MLVRSALGMFCATALVTAAAAPAVASDRGSDRSRDSLRVTVCKQVNNWDRGNNDNGGHRDRRFGFDASTDRDNTRFRLGDDECKRFNLRFRDNRFTLEEQNTRGYNVRFRVRGDDERTRSRDGRLWVTFNDRTFSPNLWITVVNSRDRNRHDNGNNNWNQN